MVDFNNETTISTPASDVEKITILERRANLIDAFEAYKKIKFNPSYSSNASLHIVSARLGALFIQLQPMLKRRMGKEGSKYEMLKSICLTSKDGEAILEAIIFINEFLDEVRLTKFDDRKVYDPMSVEEENSEKGF